MRAQVFAGSRQLHVRYTFGFTAKSRGVEAPVCKDTFQGMGIDYATMSRPKF